MKALIDLEEREGLSTLKKAEYYKSYFIEGKMIVIVMDLGVGSGIPVFSRHARPIEERLSTILGVKVKLIPKTTDIRSLASSLLYPARILGVNTLWMPDGSVEYVVRVSRFDRRVVEPSRKEYERILSEILKCRVQIRIE